MSYKLENIPLDCPGTSDTGTSPPTAIINPTREAWDEPVTARVILTFTLPDYRYLCRLVEPAGPVRYVYNCALREGSWDGRPITLTAPALGAPYAVMVLEKLLVLGARMVLALGWCGFGVVLGQPGTQGLGMVLFDFAFVQHAV